MTASVSLGLAQGQDASWDLRNYHYYDPYAFLHGRPDVDVAPAQLQTWLSPFWDLPYYGLARASVDSRITTALLSIPAGVALFLLALLFRRLAPRATGGVALMAALVLGATGAGGMPVIGTTMSDWHDVALLLAAVWLVLVARDAGSRRLLLYALAGLCGGAAVGLKLTAAPFAFGLAAMVVVLPGRPRARIEAVLAMAAGGAVGFVVVYGPWAWILYHRYANPFFPFLNDVFGSPLLPPSSFRDERFVARGVLAVLALPVRMCWRSTMLVTEGPVRDIRIVLGFLALAWLAIRHPPRPDRVVWRALAILFVVSYAVWARFFGILRYAVFLEVLACMAVVAAVWTLTAGARRVAALAVLTVTVLGTTIWPSWTRIRHGAPAIAVELPSVPPDAMVVLATLEPLAYVVPSLPPEVPVVRLIANFLDPVGSPSKLQDIALSRVRGNRGPLLLLAKRDIAHELHYTGQPVLDMLAAVGMAPEMEQCTPVRTRIEGEDLVLCPLRKTGASGTLPTPRSR